MLLRRFLLPLILVLSFWVGMPAAVEAAGSATIGHVGPTGLQVNIDRDGQLKVTGADAGSPADGKFEKGQIVTRINGRPALPETVEEGKVFPR
ncbi:MAG: hypothetical protein R3336_08460, partial [Phycisphaeraceae bacterium]|nr:hypothetical protein [Phycisphaeraceae bacterium]